MRVRAILNGDSGTLKSTDIDEFCGFLADQFKQRGHHLSCDTVYRGDELLETLEAIADDAECELIVTCGGDGTVSAAAATAWKSGKGLGVLPGGTMNLFARSLKMPLELETAVEALAAGSLRDGDIATANGRPFIHQFAAGFHPRIVEMRNRMEYASRYGKILASLRAILSAAYDPPNFPVALGIDNRASEKRRLSAITVANNQLGVGHLPFADRLDEGVLGIYSAGVLTTSEAVKLIFDVMIGDWAGNEVVDGETAKNVTLEFPRRKKRSKAIIDGEVIPLDKVVELKTHPGELKLLYPPETAINA